MEAQVLIDDLQTRTHDHIQRTQALLQHTSGALNARSAPGKWSALECIEHLNRYGDFYLPEVNGQLAKAARPAQKHYRPGWLGDYFAQSMLPREPLNRMSTFRSMNPSGSQLDKDTLHQFIRQQEQWLQLLEQSREVDLQRTKTAISISRWIKLRLGDTLRIVIYHNFRHLLQAEQAVKG